MTKFKLAGAMAIATSAILMSGCLEQSSRWDIKEVGSETYMIDQQDGSSYYLEDGVMIELRKIRSQDLASKTVRYDRTSVAGVPNVDVKFMKSFHGETMLWELILMPSESLAAAEAAAPQSNGTSQPSFDTLYDIAKGNGDIYNLNMIAFDASGITLDTIELKARDMVSTKGDNGSLAAISFTGRERVPPYVYAAIKDIDFTWSVKR